MRLDTGRPRILAALGLAPLILGIAGCSKMSSPTEPTSPQPAIGSTTVNITSSGVSLHSLTVAPRAMVTFVNNDSAPHEMASNPHPVHTQCPELNGPVLSPGASFTATMAAMSETCGFHDHLNPTNAAFQGTIVVSPSGSMSGSGAGSR